MSLTTYDGSGQVVHPDVLALPDGLNGRAYWLAFTPYPNGDNAFENPSIVANEEARAWAVPPGGVNPLVHRPESGYNSDPDIVFNPDTRELWYYFRTTANRRDVISLITSRDGVRWSVPLPVLSANQTGIISPAIVRNANGDWMMWSVNGADGGCRARSTAVERRTSRDGLRWSAPALVSWEQPGYVVWHLDVQYIPQHGEYWAVFAAYPVGSGCAADDLFFARSTDGVRWRTHPSPVLRRGEYTPFQNVVYRSTFTYDPVADLVRFWVSGARYQDASWIWSVATVQWRTPDLLEHISRPSLPPSATSRRLSPGAPVVWDTREERAHIAFP